MQETPAAGEEKTCQDGEARHTLTDHPNARYNRSGTTGGVGSVTEKAPGGEMKEEELQGDSAHSSGKDSNSFSVGLRGRRSGRRVGARHGMTSFSEDTLFAAK